MTATPVVHVEDNTPEQVALRLWQEIFTSEFHDGTTVPDRNWILDTYAECIMTVKAPGRRFNTPGKANT